MTKLNNLQIKASSLPETPGCYLMKNKREEIIYVGKAKNLKKRVKSYFLTKRAKDESLKTKILLSHVTDFDFVMTDSEAESLVLENNLIKKYSPKYNILLKDDKSYPYVLIDYSKAFPKLEYVRRPKRGKKRTILGPFVTGTNIRGILRILTKSFKLRDCTDREFEIAKKNNRACILHQMKQCSAPCISNISKENYMESLENSLLLFSKDYKKAIEKLEGTMKVFSENEEFEAALIIRDSIDELKEFKTKSMQEIAEFDDDSLDVDVIAFHEGDNEIDIVIYMVRRGILLGGKNFDFLVSEMWDNTNDVILGRLLNYYSSSEESLPKKIIIDIEKENVVNFETALFKTLNTNIVVKKTIKKFKKILLLTKEQARENQRIRIKNSDSVYVALNRLKDLLKLKERPRIIECYDIAVWQGKSPTAAKILFKDGVPDRKSYRHYHLKELPEGNNDFQMLKEVIERRIKEKKYPDIFLIDGGISQVNSVKQILNENELKIPVVGIAKAKTLSMIDGYKSEKLKRSDERLVIPGRTNPVVLSKIPALFKLMVTMRDEAHRFSRRLHHRAEEKRIFKS